VELNILGGFRQVPVVDVAQLSKNCRRSKPMGCPGVSRWRFFGDDDFECASLIS